MKAWFNPRPHLSLIVAAYDMARELPRTIHSLSRAYQRDIDALRYEIIVVDNGSPAPVQESELKAIAPEVRLLRIDNASPSPASAINMAARSACAPFIGLMIDGARIASPGLLRYVMDAHRLDPDALIGTYGFHLGPDVQMKTVFEGYDQEVEDRLLESVNWRENGYRLFEISVFAGASGRGWFKPVSESNALFMARRFWEELGGLDERFQAPGGGLVNPDLWKRAVELAGEPPIMILGEGTFHQVHGGAATNKPEQAREAMRDEYAAIVGKPLEKPEYQPRLIGQLRPECGRLDKAATARPAKPAGHRQVKAVRGRDFAMALPAHVVSRIQAGTLKTRYKGLRFCKDPFDVVLYLRLLERLKPATIFEVGTSAGGSAVWFRDQCRALGLDTQIVSIDREPPDLDVEGVRFLKGDAGQLDADLPPGLLEAAPHPWLVSEDSAHTFEVTRAVIESFHPHTRSGDYLVIEDGNVADMPEPKYALYEDGPNRAVADFLEKHGAHYEIDETLCDFYGHNVTFCPNGWIRRI